MTRRPVCIECGAHADDTLLCDAHKPDYADPPKPANDDTDAPGWADEMPLADALRLSADGYGGDRFAELMG